MPVLSDTAMRARAGRRRCSVMACFYTENSDGLQRQLWLLLPGAACAAGCRHRHGIGLLKAPDHARRSARLAVDDQLDAAARSLVAGKVHAVFKLHAALAGIERPH